MLDGLRQGFVSVHVIPCLCLAKGVCSIRVAFLSTAAPRRGALPDPEQQPSLKSFSFRGALGPVAASRPRHTLFETQGDRKWASPRGQPSSHRTVRRRQSRRNRNPNTRLSRRRRNRGGVSRRRAPRSVPLVSGIVGRGGLLLPT